MNVSEKNSNYPVESTTCDTIEIIDYNSKQYNEYTMETTEGHGFVSLGDIAGGTIRWINIDRQCTEEVLKEIGGIREIKKNLLIINRCIWPLRDVASLMGKESNELIRPSMEPYRCTVPWYNGTKPSREETEILWDKYYTGAPERQRQPAGQYKIVKRV